MSYVGEGDVDGEEERSQAKIEKKDNTNNNN